MRVCLLPATCLAVLLLAAAPRISDAQARLTVPASVDSGEAVAIGVAGAGPGDRLEIWGPIATGEPGARIAGYSIIDGVAVLTAPVAPGSYELRLVGESGSTLARAEFEVAAVPVTLAVDARIDPGRGFPVDWQGPAAPGDRIQLVDPATGVVLSEVPADGAPFRHNATEMQAPDRPGDFEVRYFSGRAGVPLKVLRLTVASVAPWLRSPIEVVAGRRFTVEWIGVPGPDDAYQLVDPATGEVLATVPARPLGKGTAPVELTAPKRPGDYRLRFVDLGSGAILSDLPLDVDPR